jgi:hypothetical protein
VLETLVDRIRDGSAAGEASWSLGRMFGGDAVEQKCSRARFPSGRRGGQRRFNARLALFISFGGFLACFRRRHGGTVASVGDGFRAIIEPNRARRLPQKCRPTRRGSAPAVGKPMPGVNASATKTEHGEKVCRPLQRRSLHVSNNLPPLLPFATPSYALQYDPWGHNSHGNSDCCDTWPRW